MLKTNVGYSILNDSYENGIEVATKTMAGLVNPKIALLYSSIICDQQKLIEGMKSVKDIPIVGCTSSGAIMVPDGIVTGENGFSGSMMFDDENLIVGVACMEKGLDARETGKQVALEAIKNSNTNLRPSYFYMVATPGKEESYLKGIQDVIGRVPMFGGSAADDTVEGNFKIYCNDKVFTDGCAVVFFYTDRKYVTEYTGAYHETNRRGIITKVSNRRMLEEIDGEAALKKYAEYRGLDIDNIKDSSLYTKSITNPFGIKDLNGNLTIINHPMIGNNDYSINMSNDLVEGTCLVMMDSTVDEFIKSTSDSINAINSKLNNVAGYLLIHSNGRKLAVGERITEIYNEIKTACGNTPFITMFSFNEYGYHDHSANICGSLMLSFTGFEK